MCPDCGEMVADKCSCHDEPDTAWVEIPEGRIVTVRVETVTQVLRYGTYEVKVLRGTFENGHESFAFPGFSGGDAQTIIGMTREEAIKALTTTIE